MKRKKIILIPVLTMIITIMMSNIVYANPISVGSSYFGGASIKFYCIIFGIILLVIAFSILALYSIYKDNLEEKEKKEDNK